MIYLDQKSSVSFFNTNLTPKFLEKKWD